MLKIRQGQHLMNVMTLGHLTKMKKLIPKGLSHLTKNDVILVTLLKNRTCLDKSIYTKNFCQHLLVKIPIIAPIKLNQLLRSRVRSQVYPLENMLCSFKRPEVFIRIARSIIIDKVTQMRQSMIVKKQYTRMTLVIQLPMKMVQPISI